MVMNRHSYRAPLRATGRAIALALAAASPVAAQSPAECARIEDGAQRLACYDRAVGRTPASGAVPASSGSPAAAADVRTPAPAGPVASAAPASGVRPSLLGDRWVLDPQVARETVFNVRYHYPNYFLLARWTDRVNNAPFSPIFAAAGVPSQELDATEAKFQVSFKARLWGSDDLRWALWAAYTQQSSWQIYNDSVSRPFRETNYQPELILAWRPDLEWNGWRWRLAALALNHQSNGRAEPLSRSWNRVYAQFGVEKDNFALLVRPWYRFEESADQDDNPDITDYLGHGDVTAFWRVGEHAFTLTGRGNVGTGKGAVQADWSFPLAQTWFGPLRGRVQVFSGYGESLIDYNWRQTTVGVGVTLNDLL
jgi:phospholipase A1